MKEKLNIFERVARNLKNDEAKAYFSNPTSTKFLALNNSLESTVVGKDFPQTTYINLKKAHSLKFESLIDQNFSFRCITIHSDSSLSDCISTAAISAPAFILSKRALDIFKTFDLGKHKVYPANVLRKLRPHKYGILHFINDMHPALDFPSSRFHVCNILGGYEFDIEIESFQDYANKQELANKG